MYPVLFPAKKIFTCLFLPPGIFVVLLLIAGILVLFRARRILLGLFVLLIGFSLYLSSIKPVKDALIMPLEGAYGIPSQLKGDSIVLLSGGVYGARDLTGFGSPKEDMMGRIVTTLRVHRQTNLPIIVTGGKGWRCSEEEAPVVKRFLVDMGVNPKKIYMETLSKDTMENAIHVKRVCDSIGSKQPILVTSAYHMKRAVLSFEKIGMKVVPVPSDFKSSRIECRDWIEYFPDVESLSGSFRAIKEYFGLVFYRFI